VPPPDCLAALPKQKKEVEVGKKKFDNAVKNRRTRDSSGFYYIRRYQFLIIFSAQNTKTSKICQIHFQAEKQQTKEILV